MAIEDELISLGLTEKTIAFDLGNPSPSDPLPLALMVVFEPNTDSPVDWSVSESKALSGALGSDAMIQKRATKYAVQRWNGPPNILRVGLFMS